MAKTISTQLSLAVHYTSGTDNPLTIETTGAILAASGSYALSLGGGVTWSVDQQGTVSAAGGIGVTLARGNLTNTGLIEGATYGVVLGGAGSVVNAGTISGGTYAVSLASGTAGHVVADPGAVFIGTVHGGGTSSSLVFASGAAQGTFAGLGSHYSGFGSYSIAGGNWLAGGSNTIAAGERMTITGSLTSNSTFVNAGTILGGANAIAVQGGTVVNSGEISVSNAVPLDVTNASVTNQAGGLLSGAYGARLHNGATLLNQGTLAGRNLGVSAIGSATITNAHGGSITGELYGAYLDGATLINAGYVATPSDGIVGADALDEAVITNQAGGTIAGYTGAEIGRVKASLALGATLLNEGLVTGAATGAYLRNDGTITNAAGGVIESGTAGVTGYGLIVNAGTISGGTAGYALQLATGAASRVVVDPGATFIGTVNGGASSTLELAAGDGTLAGLGSSVVGFTHIAFDAGSNWLIEGSAGDLGGGETITGLVKADTLELVGTVESYAALAGGVLTLSGGTTLDLPDLTGARVTNDGTNTYITACFASGTSIATARGDVPVEALRVGERVPTAAGRLAPVTWIGHRGTALRRHPSPHDVMPVRVRAGAFGEGLPRHDLVLSPDHAVLIDGRLVPVRHLVNNVSIVQETRERVTYWHVELDRHDVILAEGMACESYLDTGNRRAFEGEAALDLHPAFGREHALATWQARGCAPILADPADPVLRALHLRLLARAAPAAEKREAVRPA